ncbi:MAG: hypothetical protein Q7S80_00295 [bacterium]|nr:hypothetical protein [bacterium]
MSEGLTPDDIQFLGTRHTKSFKAGRGTESPEYPGITEGGVELAQTRARAILEHIKSAPEGTVFFLAGASELVRSKSTLRVYGDELEKLITEDDALDIEVIGEDEVVSTGASIGESVRSTAESVRTHPDEKVVVVAPLAMAGFGVRGVWTDAEGKMPYYSEIQKRAGNNDDEAIKFWLENFRNEGGVLQVGEDSIHGPDPRAVAENQLKSIRRLHEFTRKYIGDRPTEIVFVGHAVNLDALAVYLADGGQMRPETFESFGGTMRETETISLGIQEDSVTFTYGDRFQKVIDNQDDTQSNSEASE